VTAPDKNIKVALLYYCRRTSPEQATGFPVRKSIELPCSGRVGTGELMQGLASGYEKVVVLSCGEKSCIHKFGCTEAKKAMEIARKLAQATGSDPAAFVFLEADALRVND
jgi:coenzyme F420-reducing hydrogenase delta subunit